MLSDIVYCECGGQTDIQTEGDINTFTCSVCERWVATITRKWDKPYMTAKLEAAVMDYFCPHRKKIVKLWEYFKEGE